MEAKDVMSKKPISVKPTTPLNEVEELLHGRNLSGVPVITDSGMAVGIITMKELFSADSKVYVPQYAKLLQDSKVIENKSKLFLSVDEKLTQVTAADLMNQEIFLVKPDTSVISLAELFVTRGASLVLVGDDYNQIEGIVSRTDLIKLFIDAKENVTQSQTYYRPVDDEVSLSQKKFANNFSVVAKNKVRLWFTVTTLLFVVGFIAGIIYVADPQALHILSLIH